MSAARRRHIGVDVDGVLAEFVGAFADLCHIMAGKKVSSVATCWDWYIREGVTRDQEAAIWAYIADNPEFWHALPAYPSTESTLNFLEGLSAKHSIYFVTKRPANAKFWTELWLSDRGMNTPTVLVSDQKGKLCSALGIDLFVDDKPENCLEVYRALPCNASVYLYAQPWNESQRAEWFQGSGGSGVKLAHTLDEVWEKEGLS